MIRSNIAQQLQISQEKLAEAKSRRLTHLCEQTLYRMCGIVDRARQDSILQEVVVDRVFVEVGDGPVDGQNFHTFGNKEFLYAISMKAPPKLCFVEISASS